MSGTKRDRGRPRLVRTALARWIEEERGGDRGAVARELGITERYLGRVCSGDRSPSLALSSEISRLSGGRVTAEQIHRDYRIFALIG